MRASHVGLRDTASSARHAEGRRPVSGPRRRSFLRLLSSAVSSCSRRPRMKRSRDSRFVSTVVLAALVSLVLGACGSTSTSDAKPEKTGHPQRVRLVDYISHVNLELVNESHSDRAGTYSNTVPLASATRKVTTDEVLDEVIAQYKQGGFFEHTTPGSAPADAPANVGKAIEVEDGGKTVTWLVQKTAPKADRDLFGKCASLFGTVYNNTYQLQSVDQAPDWQTPSSPKKSTTPKKGS
jgi:hypothetical protein